MSKKLHIHTFIKNAIFLEGIENLIRSKISSTANIIHQDSLLFFEREKEDDKKEEMLIYDIEKFSSKEFNEMSRLLSYRKKLKVLILTSNINISDVKLLFELGVMGIINTNVTSVQFVDFTNRILEGDKVLSPEYWDLIVQYFFHSIDKEHAASEEMCTKEESLLLAELTGREKEILGYICDGKSTREISEDLFLSLHTVETHRKKILNKMGVKNTASMVKMAIKYNLYAL